MIRVLVPWCVLAGAWLAPSSGEATRGLFEPVDAPTHGAAIDDPTVVRARPVRVNLGQAVRLPAAGEGSHVEFNLFGDVKLLGRIDRIESRSPTSYRWFGMIPGHSGGTFTAVIVGDIVVANIRAPDRGSFQIRYLGSGVHTVREIDESRFAPCACGPQQEVWLPHAAPPIDRGLRVDDGSGIDVLVVYTPAARSAAGGTTAINALVDLAVAETNTAYANSQVDPRLNLVYSGEIAYTESGSGGTDLSRFRSDGDGYLDEVHGLRDAYGADLCSLIVNNMGGCGIAYLMTNLSTGFASSAFSVTKRTCATGYFTFGHELGHNMGCAHDRDNAGSAVFSYSYGYREPGQSWRTVMAYAPGTRLQYFSNPDVLYGGQPMGVPVPEPDSAHNALSINNVAFTVANFRAHVPIDCNSNGIDDPVDIAAGTSQDCDGNFIPDECELAGNDCNNNQIPDQCDVAGNDCNNNLVPDSCDLAGGTSQDCTGNGIPDECENDCNGNGYRDDCDLAAGTSMDCNTNAIPDECDPDCNANGVPDGCDLAAGTSADCDLSAVPDECDIAAGSALDCNTNSLPDDCDIASGSSNDCNTNGVPDECDTRTCQDLWSGFDGPPFRLNGGVHGTDVDGDGATWDNPAGTALVFPIGCQAGDTADYAVKVSVDDTLSTPEDGYVTSEPFRPVGGPGDCDAAIYALRLAPKIEFGIDSRWDWELIVYDTVNSARVVWLEFASTTSQAVGAGAGHILVKEPATPPGVYLDTGVLLAEATCWDVELVLDNVAGTVAVFIDGLLSVTTTPLETGARRMDHFRLHPVDNGSVSASTTKFSLDGFGLCLTGCRAVAPPVYDCNNNGVLDTCDITSGVSADCNGNSVADECETLVGGDFDADGDVDLDDYGRFLDCMAGPGAAPVPLAAGCAGTCLASFDADGDTDVDAADFAAFQDTFTGAP